jgi:hypothetical protein
MAQWRCKSTFNGPTVLESRPGRSVWDSELSRPFCDAERAPIERDITIPTSVLGLLSACRPSAVARFVVAVVVDTLQRPAIRHRSHVVNEGLEGGSPAFANGDAASSPHVKSERSRVVASRLHLRPRFAFWSVVQAMFGGFAHTATAFDVSVKQTASVYKALGSAIAFAQLHDPLSNSKLCLADSSQASELLSSDVCADIHGSYFKAVWP